MWETKENRNVEKYRNQNRNQNQKIKLKHYNHNFKKNLHTKALKSNQKLQNQNKKTVL